MKKLLVMLMMLACFAGVEAKEVKHEKTEIKDSTITLVQGWDCVMRWVVANAESYGMQVVYENPALGSIIVKGEFEDNTPYLQSARNDLIVPIVSFTIEVACMDGKVSAEMSEVTCEFKNGYGSVYSLSTFILKECKQELEEIERIMLYKGHKVNCYDSWFEETANEYKTQKEAAQEAVKNEITPKKERKKAKKYLEQNGSRSNPYSCISMMPWSIVRELFYGDKGLRHYIQKR